MQCPLKGLSIKKVCVSVRARVHACMGNNINNNRQIKQHANNRYMYMKDIWKIVPLWSS